MNHFRKKKCQRSCYFSIRHGLCGTVYKESSLKKSLSCCIMDYIMLMAILPECSLMSPCDSPRSSGSNVSCFCWWLEEAMLKFKENEWEGNVTRVTTEPAEPQEKEDTEAPDAIYYDKTAQCIGKFEDVCWCKFQHLSPVSPVLHKLN